jgi:hypothetical protein
MRTQEEIVNRIGILTAIIGRQQDLLYDMALVNKERKCIWGIHQIDKKMQRAYSEIIILEWVMGEEQQRTEVSQ